MLVRSFFPILPGLKGVLPVVLAVASAAGCVVGAGSGSAKGPLWIEGCLEGKPYGTPDDPADFDLAPTFFAGEPIEDFADTNPTNRLIIRMQRTGNEPQISDTLFFDIPDSGKVADCLRGRTVGGVPDWDTGSGILGPDGMDDPNEPPWCGPVGPNGVPRIRLVPFGPVRSALTPYATCQSSMHPPAVVSVTGVAKDGWIDFVNFGGAAQPNKVPEDRVPDDQFQINFGERLKAYFHVELDDLRVQQALHDRVDLPPDPHIGGTLDGDFDFDLERGRSGQTFP